ncbi:MAG: hypothetical protein ACJ761_00675 [Chloroflexota bacterium]
MRRARPVDLLLLAAVAAIGLVAMPTRAEAALAAVIQPGSVGRSSLALDATYSTNLHIGWSLRRITVDSIASIRNTSGGPIDRVELNTIAAKIGALRGLSVTVEGVSVAARISDQTIVVPLGGILPVGGSIRVRTRYSATLRSGTSGSDWLFTRTNDIASIYRWVPWVSRATAFARTNPGDPFVTPSSRSVRVRIWADRALVYATTGRQIAADATSRTFLAANVRDFTVTASPSYRIATGTVGMTTVVGYARTASVARAFRDQGVRFLRRYESLLGPYPWSNYRVVQSSGGFAMESPNLVWIPYGVASSRIPYLVAHETAHQWFYSMVGNDQAREPFTDEAAADFLARYVLGTRRASRCSTGYLDRTIYEYTNACYFERIYIQGGNLIDDARRRIGSTRFWGAMRDYVTAERFKLAHERTLLNALDAATSLDLSTTFRPRFPRYY